MTTLDKTSSVTTSNGGTMDACRQTDGCCCQECMGGNEQFTRDELVTLARIAGQLFNEYGDRNDILSRYQRALVRGVQATS